MSSKTSLSLRSCVRIVPRPAVRYGLEARAGRSADRDRDHHVAHQRLDARIEIEQIEIVGAAGELKEVRRDVVIDLEAEHALGAIAEAAAEVDALLELIVEIVERRTDWRRRRRPTPMYGVRNQSARAGAATAADKQQRKCGCPHQTHPYSACTMLPLGALQSGGHLTSCELRSYIDITAPAP